MNPAFWALVQMPLMTLFDPWLEVPTWCVLLVRTVVQMRLTFTLGPILALPRQCIIVDTRRSTDRLLPILQWCRPLGSNRTRFRHLLPPLLQWSGLTLSLKDTIVSKLPVVTLSRLVVVSVVCIVLLPRSFVLCVCLLTQCVLKFLGEANFPV